MDVVTIALASFDAGHVLPEDPQCSAEGHGHSWQVMVEVTGDLNVQRGRARGSDGLETALETLVSELNGRSLNKMMPGATPSPNGIALWVMERLSLKYPRITTVTVAQGTTLQGRAIRTIRE